MKSKKNSLSLLAVGVSLGILAFLVLHNSSYFQTNISKASGNTSKPQYVNTLDELTAKPIIKDKILKANSQYSYLLWHSA